MGVVKISTLVFDPTIWPRLERDTARVNYFVDVIYAEGDDPLPKVKVERKTRRVLGGWHTVAALQTLKVDEVDVEWVDLKDNSDLGALLYAYREDSETALPYRDTDVKSVARRVYGLLRGTNGDLPNVSNIARQLGRSQRTVSEWLKDLVEKDKADLELKRDARVLAVHVFRAIGLTFDRIGVLVGVSKKQAFTDSELAITKHIADSRIVSAAQSQIHLALGNGAEAQEVDAARDWLISQTDPDFLERRQRQRVWTEIATVVKDWRDEAQRLPQAPEEWVECETARTDILEALEPIETLLAGLRGRLA